MVDGKVEALDPSANAHLVKRAQWYLVSSTVTGFKKQMSSYITFTGLAHGEKSAHFHSGIKKS